MEKKTIEVAEKTDEAALRKTRVAIRSAKAAHLLSSLKNRLLDSTIILMQQEEEEKLRKENEELRVKLVMVKMKNWKINLCGLAEFLLKVVLCICFWSLLGLLIAFGFF